MDFGMFFMDFLTKRRVRSLKIENQPLFHQSLQSTDLIVTQSGFVKTDETWRQPPLYALDSRLYFVMDGSGMLISDLEEMHLEAGNVYLAPCGMKCGFYGTPSVTKLYFHIQMHFDKNDRDLFSKLTHFLKRPISIAEIERLKSLYLSTEIYDHFLLKGRLYRTVYDFIEDATEDFAKSDCHSPFVIDAIRYISTHLNAKLTVREVAEATFCSPSKLAKLFEKELGQSVAAYIDNLIMSEAKNLLMYSDSSIGKISDKLGFCDQFYFSRQFRKHFGASPSQYRRSKT